LAVSQIAVVVLRASGALLVGAGVIHLLMTDHLMRWFSAASASPQSAAATSAMALNHIVVGLLLLPVGVSLWAVSAPLAGRQSWARPIALSASAAVLALPGVLFFTTTSEMLESAGFVAAVVMTSAAAAAAAVAALYLSLRRADQ
jgi:glucan phosphoethanolaminetransferase (alkaline phosphatase superfamily)